MERKITVRNEQTILDLAIQEAGTIEAIFEIAQRNGLSITDKLYPGTELIVPDFENVDADIQAYYKSKGLFPATALNVNDILNQSGIGYWAIGRDFKVG